MFRSQRLGPEAAPIPDRTAMTPATNITSISVNPSLRLRRDFCGEVQVLGDICPLARGNNDTSTASIASHIG
jgi:hypothetical protein